MLKVTQVTLSLESKSGVLATVARVLADAGVNITALNAEEAAGRGKLRLLGDAPAKAIAALKAAKYRPTEQTGVTVALDSRPGALAGVAEKLAQAKINIKSAYATTAAGGPATLVLSVPNADKAVQALGR